MCGRAAVIRGGGDLARMVGAGRVIYAAAGAGPRAAGRAAAARPPAAGAIGGFFADGGHVPPAADRAVGAGHQSAAADSNQDWPTIEKDKSNGAGVDDTRTTLVSVSNSSTSCSSPSTLPSPNFNCGPTSLMPIMRIETNEDEQYKRTEHIQNNESESQSTVAADTTLDSSTATPRSASPANYSTVVHYMHFGFPNPLAGRSSRDVSGGGGGGTIGSLVFNARSETIDEKGMWKKLVRNRRCVVLVDGYTHTHTQTPTHTNNKRTMANRGHERVEPQRSISYNIIVYGSIEMLTLRVSDSHFVLLAAIPRFFEYQSEFSSRTGEVVKKHPYFFHIKREDKMTPKIDIPKKADDDVERWLNHKSYTFEQVQSLMRPYEGLGCYKVASSSDRRTATTTINGGIECIEPIEQFEKRQRENGIGRFFTSQTQKKKKTDEAPTTTLLSPSSSPPIPSVSSPSLCSSDSVSTHLTPSDRHAVDRDVDVDRESHTGTVTADSTCDTRVEQPNTPQDTSSSMSHSHRKRKVDDDDNDDDDSNIQEVSQTSLHTILPSPKRRKPTAAERARAHG